MAFQVIDGKIGLQAIAATSTTQNQALGLTVQAKDPTLGVGEFIYLKGVGSTVVGSIVNYDDNFQTALDTSATAGPSRPLAVAMSANVASQYGWYQISGLAVATKANSVSFADGAGLGAGLDVFVAINGYSRSRTSDATKIWYRNRESLSTKPHGLTTFITQFPQSNSSLYFVVPS